MSGVHSPSAHTQRGAAKSVADILNAAADLIEPEGRWTQGEWKRERIDTDECAWCAEGAIALAAGIGCFYMVRDSEPYRAFRNSLPKRQDPFEWNDAPGRTQAEVVTALRAAAEKARAAASEGSVGTKADRPKSQNPQPNSRRQADD